jgi:hypothetical protein
MKYQAEVECHIFMVEIYWVSSQACKVSVRYTGTRIVGIRRESMIYYMDSCFGVEISYSTS